MEPSCSTALNWTTALNYESLPSTAHFSSRGQRGGTAARKSSNRATRVSQPARNEPYPADAAEVSARAVRGSPAVTGGTVPGSRGNGGVHGGRGRVGSPGRAHAPVPVRTLTFWKTRGFIRIGEQSLARPSVGGSTVQTARKSDGGGGPWAAAYSVGFFPRARGRRHLQGRLAEHVNQRHPRRRAAPPCPASSRSSTYTVNSRNTNKAGIVSRGVQNPAMYAAENERQKDDDVAEPAEGQQPYCLQVRPASARRGQPKTPRTSALRTAHRHHARPA